MKTVYIAGPIGYGSYSEQVENCRRATKLALRLSRAGIAVVCVHALALHDLSESPEQRLGQILAQDFELLRRCDALVLVTTDYSDSDGTCREVAFARAHGLPVLTEFEVIAWARGKGTSGITGTRGKFRMAMGLAGQQVDGLVHGGSPSPSAWNEVAGLIANGWGMHCDITEGEWIVTHLQSGRRLGASFDRKTSEGVFRRLSELPAPPERHAYLNDFVKALQPDLGDFIDQIQSLSGWHV